MIVTILDLTVRHRIINHFLHGRSYLPPHKELIYSLTGEHTDAFDFRIKI